MPNIATILKDEIARVARREVRAETQKLKKSSAQHRTVIAALRRQVAALEQRVARVGKSVGKAAPVALGKDEDQTKHRFSAKRLAAHRQRLGLSAAQFAILLGVSAQSVYKWEDGKTRPRASQLPAIAALGGISKKDAAARLAESTR